MKEETFGTWQKIEAPITAEYVVPIIYLGTLYVFWHDIQTKPEYETKNGEYVFKHNKYEIELQYTSILTNGSWQKVKKIKHPSNPKPSQAKLSAAHWDRPYLYILKEKLCWLVKNDMSYDYHQIDVLNNTVVKNQGFRGRNFSKIKVITNSNDNQLFFWTYLPEIYPSQVYYKSYEFAFMKFPRSSEFLQRFNSGDLVEEAALWHVQVHPVNNWLNAFIIEVGSYSYLIFENDAGRYTRIPLNSLLANQYKEILFYEGLDKLLSLETQQLLETEIHSNIIKDHGHPLHSFRYTKIENYHPQHSSGIYFQELFFHIPCLIANTLHSNQQFEAAHQWYKYLFDPSSVEERKNEKTVINHPYDRVWKYVGFLGRGQESLKDILYDKDSTETYEQDPFNPHAIARQRRNAYQKTIFMAFIDNLLDWGDQSFRQDTMESINEATLLYVMAYDILGKRPAEVGDCETLEGKEARYKALEGDNTFLKELETYYYNIVTVKKATTITGELGLNQWTNIPLINGTTAQYSTVNYANNGAYNWSGTLQKTHKLYSTSHQAMATEKAAQQQATIKSILPATIYQMTSKHIQLFCVPRNEHLISYWDKVEDRLYKIRNCMNIDGIKRQLALFQPPIDPMMLVKAKAAGLSLQDVLLSTSVGDRLYRFSFLIEQAKSFAAKVQNLGSALLDALERRDAEKLAMIRTQQQQQLQQMSTLSYEQRLQELQVSERSLELDAEELEYKINYYQTLINTGKIAPEIRESNYKTASRLFLTTEQLFRVVGVAMYLLPNLGSPFEFNYGGKQLGDSGRAWGDGLRSLSGLASSMAAASGDQAAYLRRMEGWNYQLSLLQYDKQDLAQRIIINKIRQKGAERALEIHEREKTYQDEVYNFMKDRFGNEQLYTWLANEQQQLYRQYYKMAMEYARMAEAAYQSERDNQFFIQGNNWNSQYAGLMAGQQLMLQLDQMEQAYLKGATRKMEVVQNFSLRLVNPQQLLTLQQTGSCSIDLPKVLFDLAYPGQYNRRLHTVTVTIPSVTGPYTNINAILSLVKSEVHKTLNGTAQAVNLGRNNSIALSSGENDGGLLFSDLHNNKYLPFEGAGAISEWRLELPQQFRSFDYSTISDVVLTLAYKADYDASGKAGVEQNLANQLATAVQQQGAMQYINIKQHFSGAFRQLLHQDSHSSQLNIDQRFFPYYLQDKLSRVQLLKTLVLVEKKKTVTWLAMPLTLGIEGLEQLALSGAGTARGEHIKEFIFNGLNGRSPIKEWSLALSSNIAEVIMDDWIENIYLILVYNLK